MKTEKIIELSAKFLNIEKYVSGEDKDQKILSLLMTALNNVISEIAEEYVPFKKRERIEVQDGQVKYSDLSETVKEILNVKSGKEKLNFRLFEKGIEVDFCGEVEITYAYIPKAVEYGDEIELPVGITERTVACGVAGEYALMSERYEECVNYDNRFLSGIKAVKRNKKERKLPYWRWI